jgi:hypothetical protein
MPLHFLGRVSLQTIGNALGKFHSISPETKSAFTTFARIYVEMVMQEHRQHQESMGQEPTYFRHMINCLKKKLLKIDAPNVNVIVKERHTYRL